MAGSYLFLAALALLDLGTYVFSQTCEEPHYERCLMQLHEFTEKQDLIYANSRQELQANCVQAQSALSCLTRYSRKCIPLEYRDEFLEKIAGPRSVILGLCADEGNLRKQYLEALPCIQNYTSGIQYCREKYDRNSRDIAVVDYQDKRHLECCSFDGYRRCLRMLLNQREDCADTVDEIVFRLGGNFSGKDCMEYFEICTGSGSWRLIGSTVLTLLLPALLSLRYLRQTL